MILLLIRYVFFFVLGSMFMASLFGAWPLSDEAIVTERERLLVTDPLVQAYVAQNRHSTMVSRDRWLLEKLTDTNLGKEAIKRVRAELESELSQEENWHCLMEAIGEERLQNQMLSSNSSNEHQRKPHQDGKSFTVRMVRQGPAVDLFELIRVSYDQGETRLRYGAFRVKKTVPFLFCKEVDFETLLDINTPIDSDLARELYTAVCDGTGVLELPSDVGGRNGGRSGCFYRKYSLEFSESLFPNSFSYDKLVRLGRYGDRPLEVIYQMLETRIEQYVPNEQRAQILGI